MVLVFYYKVMLEKVTTQRTQHFSAFSSLPKEPSKMQRMRSCWKNCFCRNLLISDDPAVRISRNLAKK